MTAPPAATTLWVGAGVHALDGEWCAHIPPRSATARPAGGRAADAAVPGTARAVHVTGDRITWVGADPRAAPPADRVLDLGGAWLLPAFVDAHVHGTATGLAAAGVNLTGSASVAEAMARLCDVAARATPGAVVTGHGWEDFRWPEGRPLHAADVAAAAPDRTVILHRIDAHSCVVDPATLAELALDGVAGVDRDVAGAPTGWLREEAARLAWDHVRPQLPERQLAAARDTACARAAALGIGALHEMGHPMVSGRHDTDVWAGGDWPLDVAVWWAELDPDPGAGLRPGGDLFLDGSIGSCTAATTTPYRCGGGSTTGMLFHDDDDVVAFFTEATARGTGAGVHAIGDAAIEQAVAALEAAARACGPDAVRACRHRIEHVELVSRGHVRRMAALDVVASVQPAFDALWGGPEQLYASRFGVAAANASNPLAWFAEAGVRLAFGSDSSVTPLDPWGAVLAAERHLGGLGIDRAAAVAAHTLGGRHVAGQDDVGPLVAGARADLVAWEGDPFAVEDPRALRAVATVVRGRCVHGPA